jgi:hypothetical protein
MNGLVAAAAAAMEDDSRMKGEGVLDRKRRTVDDDVTGSVRMEDSPSANLISASEANKRRKTASGRGISAAKSRRLEQNRRAAIESRRRKKIMVSAMRHTCRCFLSVSWTSILAPLIHLRHKLFL